MFLLTVKPFLLPQLSSSPTSASASLSSTFLLPLESRSASSIRLLRNLKLKGRLNFRVEAYDSSKDGNSKSSGDSKPANPNGTLVPLLFVIAINEFIVEGNMLIYSFTL